MNAKILVFVICIKAIIYLLLNNLYDCTFKQINNKSFYLLLIILSSDISLNPGLACKNQLLNTTEWDIFKTKGLHLMHLNINSLLPKIDELRHMTWLSNAAVIGIYESK